MSDTMEKTPAANEQADGPQKPEPAVFEPIDPAVERRVLRKLDLLLLPLLCICYMLQFLDKSSLNYATLMNIRQDLNLVGSQYSWASSIFYFGYLLMSYPTSYFIVKFPIGYYVSSAVILWAAIIMVHAACHDFAGIATVRFFLGVTEATVAPAFAILVGSFYKRSEQPLRQCFWFVGNAFAGIIGGLIAYGIAHINSGFAQWKASVECDSMTVLFLLFGGCTIVWGVVMVLFLPNSPGTCRFLTPEERDVAVRRLQTSAAKQTTNYKMYQVKEALLDPQTWILVVYQFCMNIPNGGLTSFGSLIISGFGYSTFRTLILQIPVACAQIFWILLSAGLATYLKNARLPTMIFMVLISVVGTVMMFAIDKSQKEARLAGFCLTVAYVANLPLTMSVVTANVAGYTKRTVVLSLTFIAYCVGNIAGPQFFISSEAPGYRSGLIAGVCGFAIAALMLILLAVYYLLQNRSRNAEGAGMDGAHQINGEEIMDDDQTDKEHRGFRYVF